MSFSTVLLQNSDDSSARGFSPRMNKLMKGVENQNTNNMAAMKILMQGKRNQGQGETKKKLCMCSPTNHPGSFRCRYHRPTSIHKVNNNNSLYVFAKEYSKLKSVKPPLSRFGKAHAVALELPR